MHASMRWAVVLVSGIVLVPSGAEAISYTFSDCQQTQLCGAPAPQPESTQSVSTTYDFSNEAAVAASIASVYFSSDGALSGMPQYDGGTTGTSDPAVLGPALSSAMAFDDIITSLDEGSSTTDGLRISAHLQGMGIGSALLREFCAKMDASGETAYLETDKPENVRFYERFGFEVIGEEYVLGVPNWFMTRRPEHERGSDERGRQV